MRRRRGEPVSADALLVATGASPAARAYLTSTTAMEAISPCGPRYPRRRGHTTDTDRPVARGASMELGAEKYEVFLYLADERGERTYVTEHRFLERPEAETVKCLFEEAKRHFSVLYEGDARPEDFEVRVTYSEGENGGC